MYFCIPGLGGTADSEDVVGPDFRHTDFTISEIHHGMSR